MKRMYFNIIILLFLSPAVLVAGFIKGNDFYTLKFQPGIGDSKIILIGLSQNERYFSYIEVYSPIQEFSQNYRAFAKIFILNVPENDYVTKPIQVSIEVENSPLDQDCFSFFEYELLSALMKKAKSQLDNYGIIPGILPVRVIPFKENGSDMSKLQSFHLFNGEMGNLAEVKLEIMKGSSPSLLDIRLRSHGIEEVEKILQRDKKAPHWRRLAMDYQIDRVYFYGNHKKYIIVFVEVIFEPEKGQNEKRYMCVSGEISKVWENAFKQSEEEMFK